MRHDLVVDYYYVADMSIKKAITLVILFHHLRLMRETTQ